MPDENLILGDDRDGSCVGRWFVGVCELADSVPLRMGSECR